MKYTFNKLINIIIFLLRLIFLPIKLIHTIIYGGNKPNILGYAWYTESEYRNLIESCQDDLENIVPTYELWKEIADKKLQFFRDKGWVIIKVNIVISELDNWLNTNNLPNTGEYREEYVSFRLAEFLQDVVI